MKVIFLFTLLLCTNRSGYSQAIAINETGAPPHQAAILDASSTKNGFLPPRMTVLQRDAMVNPPDGLVIFNTTAGCINYFFKGSWYEWRGAISFPTGQVHCSGTPTAVVDVVNPTTGRTWMDRNLGASRAATSSTDDQAYGDLYQWGRRADGHQCRNSAATTTLSSTDQPAHGSFIVAPNSPFDWLSLQNTNLWQGVNGVNNPCPSGYRIPTEAELNAERLSWSSNNAAGALSSTLKLPMAGSRIFNTGGSLNIGSSGIYWSSTVSSTDAHYLDFWSTNALTSTFRRAGGFSVRCIKEVPIVGFIQTLSCSTVINTGTLFAGTAANMVSSSLAYNGGNGGTYNGQTVTSTGVTGLTATLAAGTFATGAGSVTYTISGTPSAAGTASFALNIGGQSCTITHAVMFATGVYPSGTVHCTPAPTAVIDVVNPVTGRTWMDRNLGASRAATSITDAQAFGDLYQWGRFAEGHQCRNSAVSNQISVGKFTLVADEEPYDWSIPQNDNLWQFNNNDPCPSGYRLPTDAELEAEFFSWSSSNANGAFASPLKWPLAGIRSFGDGAIGAGFGMYWSSTTDGTFAYNLRFNGGDAFISSSPRAAGYSVRCIKESPAIGFLQSLLCADAIKTGELKKGTVANGVSFLVPYTGGNGGIYDGQIVNSSGVSGLIARLSSGSFTMGSGELEYIVSGTPANDGTAFFTLNIGGQTCTVALLVSATGSVYPAGTVHCTPTPTAVVDVVNPATGRTWMDRNLGASRAATSSTDTEAYGDLYQWGRRADGHQCRNSAITNALSSTDQPTHSNFIIVPNSPPYDYDWRSPQNNNLWQGVNGVNNPCPSGYRLPTSTELNAELLSFSSNNALGALASPLKLPMAGYRGDVVNLLLHVGTAGYYWSSSIHSKPSFLLIFTSSIAEMGAYNRAMGLAVRCLKD